MPSRSSNAGHTAERTCVACRNKSAITRMLKFSVISDEIVFDLYRNLPEKGKYICKSESCLSVLESKWLKKFQKKLKRNGKSSKN